MSVWLFVKLGIYALFAIPQSLIDIKKLRAPLPLSIAAFLTLLAFFIAEGFFMPRQILFNFILTLALGLFLSLLIYLVARLLTSGGLGKGDIWWGCVTGFMCGYPSALIAVFFSALLGIFYYIFLSVRKKSLKKGGVIYKPFFAVPYVPFISVGALLVQILFSWL